MHALHRSIRRRSFQISFLALTAISLSLSMPDMATAEGETLHAPRWRVGIQVGHWLVDRVPAELKGLGAGAFAHGLAEWEVNFEHAHRVAAYLEAEGVQVDLLPATIPPGYRADVFIAIHADFDERAQRRGFKVARPGMSTVPELDDRLVSALVGSYADSTGLPQDDAINITPAMRYYYAFNSRRFQHAVAEDVPKAIVETGYLTSPDDLHVLVDQPDRLAQGVALGILRFLQDR